VDLRELFGHLYGQRIARRGELLLLHDAAADRVAFEPLHHERLASLEIGDVAVWPRHLHAGLVCGFDHGELVRERERVSVDHAARGPSHEQRLAVGVDRPGLLRRTPRQQDRFRELDLAAEHLRQQRLERLAHLCDHCCRWRPLSSLT